MPITQYNSSVRQMSQSKFDSMKNASGKIPDLANQIVMTNSEDTNISCLRTEVVYDMTSSDANINWGYPNGIKNNVTVTGKDFSKYEKLIAYCYANYYIYPVEIDLTKSTSENFYLGRLCIGKGMSMLYFAGGETNLEKTSFKARIFRVNPTTNMSDEYDEDLFYVYKIEGVLKTPAMIYTGNELIAGNGISIANGVISSTQVKVLIEFTKQINTNIESTSDTTITGLQYFTKKSETSKLLVFASAYIQDNTGGYGSGLRFYLDSNEITSLSNASKTHSIMQTLNNVSAGQHSYNLALIAGAGKAIIPSYNVTYLVVLEVE